MGKCTTKNCQVSLSVPLDEALGITPYQSSSEELIRLGCLLSIVMPYELSSWMLQVTRLLRRRLVAVLGDDDSDRSIERNLKLP